MQIKEYYSKGEKKKIKKMKNQRLNNYKRDKGNGYRNFCEFLCYKERREWGVGGAEGEGSAILSLHQPHIASSAPFDITVNTSASAPRPLYSRHTMHTKTISRDRGILDDFLIGFIPLSCHQSNDNKSI